MARMNCVVKSNGCSGTLEFCITRYSEQITKRRKNKRHSSSNEREKHCERSSCGTSYQSCGQNTNPGVHHPINEILKDSSIGRYVSVAYVVTRSTSSTISTSIIAALDYYQLQRNATMHSKSMNFVVVVDKSLAQICLARNTCYLVRYSYRFYTRQRCPEQPWPRVGLGRTERIPRSQDLMLTNNICRSREKLIIHRKPI